MVSFEPKHKFPEGDIECQLCYDKFSGHMRLRSLTRHLKENHGGITLKEYFDMFYGNERDSHCLHCGADAPWYKSFYRDFCDRSCDTAFRNMQNWKNEEYRKTRSDFVKGQWEDEKFRNAICSAGGKATTKRLVESWKNDDYRKKMTDMANSDEFIIKQSNSAINQLRDKNSKFGNKQNQIYEYQDIHMRSNLEVDFAKELDCVRIKWEYEPKVFRNGLHSFLPDFYIEILDLFVEIKSTNFIDEKMINKIKFIEYCGHNAILINPKNWDKSVSEIVSKAINLKGGKGGIDGSLDSNTNA